MRYHIKIDVNLLAICLKHTLAKYEEKENLKVQMVFLSVKWFAINHALGSLSCKESVFSGGNSSLSGLQIYSSNRLLKIFFS